MTPVEALKQRDYLLSYLRDHRAAIQEADPRPAPRCDELEEAKDWLPDLLERAEVVIWKDAFWVAALAGAEVFRGAPPPLAPDTVRPQLWIFEATTRPDYYDPADAEPLGVPPDWVVSSVLLCPRTLKGEDGVPRPTLDLLAVFLPPSGSGFPAPRLVARLVAGEPVDHWCVPPVAGLCFMEQEFVTQEPALLPRQMRRLRERKRRPVPPIHTILLRRAARKEWPADQDPGEGEPGWTCQWLVSGHWRRPAPQMHDQRPVYVRPHVKGPADLPLKPPRKNVYIVNR